MMQCHWLFESDTFGEDIKGIVEEVRRQGMPAVVAHYVPLTSGQSYQDIYPPDVCVMFYGSINFARQINAETEWIPGAMGYPENFRCSSYYPHFGPLLLNGVRYGMYPYGELIRMKDMLYDIFGKDNTIFIRPDTPDKLFTGALIERRYFDKDIPRLGYDEIHYSKTVVVAKPRNISSEWRFIIADRQIIASSMYRLLGEKFVQEGSTKEARFIAEAACHIEWQPDRMYALDVGQTRAGAHYIVEIGDISTCGWYACDRTAVVAEASRIALEEWQEAQEHMNIDVNLEV